MKRRSVPVAAAAAALLLTACGGGGDSSKDKGGVAEADTGGTKTPAAPSPSPSGTIERPDIRLPGNVHDDFEGWRTGDGTKDAVLADAGRAQTATNHAIIAGNPNDPALAFYRQGHALVSGSQWVKSFVDAGISYVGTVKYYNPYVVRFGKSSAGVTFCTDESKAFNQNRKTKKVDRTPADENSYVFYNTRVKKAKNGVWQTTELVSIRGSKKCTP